MVAINFKASEPFFKLGIYILRRTKISKGSKVTKYYKSPIF
jgi:hypothetical protein